MINEEKRQSIIMRGLKCARRAAEQAEVPVGAVVFFLDTGEIVAAAGNATQRRGDALAHAEMLALDKAARKLGSRYLDKCGIYTTLEPCPMCAVAISYAKVARLFFGARDEKAGGVLHGARVYERQKNLFVPAVEYGEKWGALEAEKILKDFFKDLRARKKQEKLLAKNIAEGAAKEKAKSEGEREVKKEGEKGKC